LKQKDWSKFNIATSTQEEIDAIEGPFGEFLSKRTKAEFADEAVKREILGYPVNNARDISADPQLVAREFWQTVEHPELGATLIYPGLFAKFSRNSQTIHRRAPRIGEHNEHIYLDELNLSRQEFETSKREGII
jgi:crotonobetainyl-CoA:carnitine CoA-transferase CaiB-like acyl-CoA transferase